MNCITTAFRPSTRNAHMLHFKTFIALAVYMNFEVEFSLSNVLAFLECLIHNKISPKVVANYVSSLKTVSKLFFIPSGALYHTSVSLYLRSIAINLPYSPTPRGVFSLSVLQSISQSCDLLEDPELFRAIFLVAFFGFLRMSNVAPHSRAKFDPSRHILRQDVVFAYPGIHLILKWTKTLQERSSHHIVQLPQLDNKWLCPVRAVRNLLKSRQLPPNAPLFASLSPPHHQIIDTPIRYALKSILRSLNYPLAGHVFHSFRISGATLAYDNSIPLQNIMAHGLWRSSSVWYYLEQASMAPSIIPLTFASIVPPSL